MFHKNGPVSYTRKDNKYPRLSFASCDQAFFYKSSARRGHESMECPETFIVKKIISYKTFPKFVIRLRKKISFTMRRFLSLVFLLCVLSSLQHLHAQLTVTQGSAMNMTPLDLVIQQLVGQGVTVSNATYNGSSALISSDQIGYFTATGGAYNELGFSGGILLTSGSAANAIGPNDQCGKTTTTNSGADPDLNILANMSPPNHTNDKCVLEFDFVPQADTLKFRYEFGSEEFFCCCSTFNDVFGFFLSGPGISGTFSNNSDDIALMPGTGNYVGITNICNDASSSWCNIPTGLNCGGGCPSYANCTTPRGGGVFLQYNAFSIVLTAWHVVTPCSTYHIKLAIADAVDHLLDSGVFLEKNSFSATGLQVTNTYALPQVHQGAIEGCADAIVSFVLQQPATSDYTVTYTIGGTATMGTDYSPIPASLIIPTGSDSTALTIHALLDGIPEGIETVILTVQIPSCSGFTYFNDTVNIYDNTILVSAATPDTAICLGSSTSITLKDYPSGGQTPYTYLWSNGATTRTTTFTPPVGLSNYSVIVTDACSQKDTSYMSVTAYTVVQVTNNPLISDICNATNTNIALTANMPGATFSWTATGSANVSGYSAGSGLVISQVLTNSGTTDETVTYHITPQIAMCTGPPSNFTVTVHPNPTLTNNPLSEQICNAQNTNITLTSSVTGTQFTWTCTPSSGNITGYSNNSVPATQINQTLFVTPSSSETVTYHITPQVNNCSGTVSNYVVTVSPGPVIENTQTTFQICDSNTITITLLSSTPGTTFAWTASGTANVTGYSSGSGSLISQTLDNTGYTNQTVTYAVTPTVNLCVGPVVNFVVTVHPTSDVYFNPVSQTICSGQTTGIQNLSHVAGTTFNWTVTTSPDISGASPGSGNAIRQTLTNLGYLNDEWAEYKVTPIANGCTGISDSVHVILHPAAPVTFTYCFDSVTTTHAKPFILKGGIPPGGIYSGPGVTNGIFSPAISGVGNHTIIYTYTNAELCSVSKSRTISVRAALAFTCGNNLTDIRDNKSYPTAQIGTQCWMAEDLNYGTEISSNQDQRDNCIAEKYHNPASSIQHPASVYQWDEIMNYGTSLGDQGLCPPGWHVPSESDWTLLFNEYINNGFAGSPLKYNGFSGFNALLSGVLHLNEKWDYPGFATFFWSSTPRGPLKAWSHGMNDPDPSVSAYPAFRTNAFSVRCIKD
jgi:uncharacterized protein (TIGR02145 family)